MNNSILGMMFFFFMAAALLTMVVGNPLTINAVQSVVISQNANENVGLGSISGSSTVSGCQNQTLTQQAYNPSSNPFLNGVFTFFSWNNPALAWITGLVTKTLGQQAGVPETQCIGGSLQNMAVQQTTGFFATIGTAVTPQSVTNNPQVQLAIGIAAVFIGLGLLAGVLGAGMLAGVISSVGIILSVIYYVMAEINLPNAQTGVPYFALPAPLELIFTAFFSVCVLWMLASSLNSSK